MTIKAKEYTEILDHGAGYIRYSYRHTGGAVFRCTGPSAEECRKARDRWIEKCYLVDGGQLVYGMESEESYFVFHPNLKGYVVLIRCKGFGIYRVDRSAFFRHFSLSAADGLPRLLDADEAYLLVLEAYRLHFGGKDKDKEKTKPETKLKTKKP